MRIRKSVDKNTAVLRFVFITVLLAVLIFAIFLLSDGIEAAYADNTTANAALEIKDSLGGAKQLNAEKLLDGKYSTYEYISANDVITVTQNDGIASLYIIWNKVPGEWTLTVNGNDYLLGQNGFLHEYIDISSLTGSPAAEVSIKVHKDISICDIYTFTEGTLPEWVQTWEAPCENADIMLMSTHSDDEHLFFAGLLPYYAGEAGAAVQVVYLTNHWDVQNRPHEQINGLWAVGVRNYPIVGPFPDDPDTLNRTGELPEETLARALEIFGEDALCEFQVEMIRRFKPQVIVCHDVNGEYQHGAHIANTYSLRAALDYAEDASKYPESAKLYGTWSPLKTYIHLWSENKIVMNWDVPLEAFGGKTAFEVSKEGYACHYSQHWTWFTRWLTGTEDGEADTILQASQINKYSPCEYGLYKTSVGTDTEADMLEHITLYREQQTASPEPAETPPASAPAETPSVSAPPQTSAGNDTDHTDKSDDQSDSDGIGGFRAYCAIAVFILFAIAAAVRSIRSSKRKSIFN